MDWGLGIGMRDRSMTAAVLTGWDDRLESRSHMREGSFNGLLAPCHGAVRPGWHSPCAWAKLAISFGP